MKRNDLTGLTFSRLTAVERFYDRVKGQTSYICHCSCGSVTRVLHSNLLSGNVKSCGCLRREMNIAAHVRHGETHRTPEYVCWRNIIDRCHNPNASEYRNYGGRGIQVCKRWRNSYQNFLADVGRRPSPAHSLDRYPDNNGDYAPGNFRWATREQQGRNRRTNVLVTLNGETLTLADWAERLGIPLQRFNHRLKKTALDIWKRSLPDEWRRRLDEALAAIVAEQISPLRRAS